MWWEFELKKYEFVNRDLKAVRTPDFRTKPVKLNLRGGLLKVKIICLVNIIRAYFAFVSTQLEQHGIIKEIR